MSTPDAVFSPAPAVAPTQIGLAPRGYVAPAELTLGTVTLQVADLERSLAFYTQVIGFEVASRDATSARLTSLGGDVLLELREKPGVKYAPHRGRLGLYHLALLLPSRGDLGRFLAQALAQGVHVGQSDHLYSEATYLMDPDGISVEVYADRPRGQWTVSPQGEIIGGGQPLNHAELQAAAQGQTWTGLPAGTVVGHMHFYVGDLAQAAEFYHHGLGLSQVGWRTPEALFVSAGGYHHHVGLNTWAAGSAPSGENDARLLAWEVRLPDEATRQAAGESLRRAGFVVQTHPDGTLSSRDPWGSTVHLTLG